MGGARWHGRSRAARLLRSGRHLPPPHPLVRQRWPLEATSRGEPAGAALPGPGSCRRQGGPALRLPAGRSAGGGRAGAATALPPEGPVPACPAPLPRRRDFRPPAPEAPSAGSEERGGPAPVRAAGVREALGRGRAAGGARPLPEQTSGRRPRRPLPPGGDGGSGGLPAESAGDPAAPEQRRCAGHPLAPGPGPERRRRCAPSALTAPSPCPQTSSLASCPLPFGFPDRCSRKTVLAAASVGSVQRETLSRARRWGCSGTARGLPSTPGAPARRAVLPCAWLCAGGAAVPGSPAGPPPRACCGQASAVSRGGGGVSGRERDSRAPLVSDVLCCVLWAG